MSVSKIEYLKRYMDGDTGEAAVKKKVKIRKKKKVSNVKIVDENIDLKDVNEGDSDAERILDEVDEDAPLIDSVTDEGKDKYGKLFKSAFEGASDTRITKRRRRDSSDSDESVVRNPRASRRSTSPGSPRRGRRDSSSDLSPPRKSNRNDSKSASRGSTSPGSPRRRRRDSSSDLSPPRKSNRNNADLGKGRRYSSDESPPRKGKKKNTKSDSDMDTPPRRRRRYRENPDREIMEMGVIDAPEIIKLRGTKSKDDSEAKADEKAREEARKEVYSKWSAGLAQQKEREMELNDMLHEASKPLARGAADKDLETRLKMIDREGDPMLAYLRKKKEGQNVGGTVYPRYKGDPPPNRYNIWPGYRWDGVDRSNGFEAKMMAMQNDRIATEEQAYKWSTEDM